MTDKKTDPKQDKDKKSSKELTKEELIKKKLEELRKRDPFIYR